MFSVTSCVTTWNEHRTKQIMTLEGPCGTFFLQLPFLLLRKEVNLTNLSPLPYKWTTSQVG